MTSTLSAIASVLTNKTPVPLSPPTRSTALTSTAGTATQAGQLRAMEHDGVLFSVVAKIAEALAGVEWHLYRKPVSSASGAPRTEVFQHVALKVWNRPNPYMSRQRLVETFSQHNALVGEAWLVPTRTALGGIPTELWPIRPDRMIPVPDPDDFIAGYEYVSPLGERILLRSDDVICVMRPNPNDPYRGLGPVQAIMSTIDSARYSSEWNRQFFANSAEPGGVLSVEGSLSDRDFQRLNYQWNEQHRGVAASHRVAILENGVTWNPSVYTRRDMQFTELMQLSDDKILSAFGMSKFMIGIIDDVNRASARAAEYVFGRWTLVPALERIKSALNNQFLPMFGSFGEGVEFDYDSPVPEDTEADDASLATRAKAAVDLINAGFDAESVREALGLPHMDLATVKKEPSPAPPPPPQAPPAAPPAVEEPGEETEEEEEEGVPVARLENAQRWEVVTQADDNRCEPCAANDGKTYKNREQAYKDYPGGSSYVRCVGEEYGNQCRCKVVKRGKADNDVTEEVSNG